MSPRIYRALALIIAVLAVVDPAITTERRVQPDISLLTGDSVEDRELATRVARELSGNYVVLPASFPPAAATVLVGRSLPPDLPETAAPGFAVIAERDGSTATIESVDAPAGAPLDARVPVAALVQVQGARGHTLTVALWSAGVTIDRSEQQITSDSVLLRVPLTFLPSRAGTEPLRVTATVDDASDSADLLIDVRAERWNVLFFDRRPSWMSTFVRRALEQDARFQVTSRTITSRNLSTDAGQPPALDDGPLLEPFDAIVVGAPELLNLGEVAGLDRFMRQRAGGVVLLLDRAADGPMSRLTAVPRWSTASARTPGTLRVGSDSTELRSSADYWPALLPAGAEAVGSANRPLLWRSAVGAGQLTVSGALDAWKFRDPATSDFDRFWQMLIAEAADAGGRGLEIGVGRALLQPGEVTDVTVTLRAPALAPLTAGGAVQGALAARLESADAPVSLRLWPDGPVGRFRGRLRAPETPGTYRLRVSSAVLSGSTPIVVAQAPVQARASEEDLMRAWAGAHAGRVVNASSLHELPAALAAVLPRTTRPVTWHPMRSAWWILPFVIALAAEWWMRRRRGLV